MNPSAESSQPDEKVIVQRQKDGKIVAYNTVLDYVYCPAIYKHMPLYTWIQTYQKVKIKIATKKSQTSDNESESDDELDIVSDRLATAIREKEHPTCVTKKVLPDKEQSDEDTDVDNSDMDDGDELDVM